LGGQVKIPEDYFDELLNLYCQVITPDRAKNLLCKSNEGFYLEDKIKNYTQRPPRSDTEGRKLNLNLYCQVITPDRANNHIHHPNQLPSLGGQVKIPEDYFDELFLHPFLSDSKKG
jgi:hypothetical protein